MNDTPEACSAHALRGRRVAAGVLLLVAAAALAGRYLPVAWEDGLILLLGLGFIVWAALARKAALLIPGCILTGIGTGVMLRLDHGNAVFLFAMAGGFALIPVLDLVLFQKRARWPFFPAAGLAFAGLTQLADAGWQRWLREAGPLWPYILIAVALYLLLTPPRVRP